MIDLIQTSSPEFEERNLFLQALLGLVAAAHGLDRLLGIPAQPGGSRREGMVRDPDPVLDAVLGLVAVRERLMQHVEHAAPARAGEPGAEVHRGAASHRSRHDGSLLR